MRRCTSSKDLVAVKVMWAEQCAERAANRFLSTEQAKPELSGILQTSAAMLLSMPRKSPSFDSVGTNIADSDRVTSWVITAEGVKLFLKCDAASLGYRRCGDYFYTPEVLVKVLARSLDCKRHDKT